MDKHQAFNMGKAYKIGYNLSKRFLAQDAAEWITVHPNGKGVSLKGEDINVDKMMLACQRGPMWGKVDSLEFVVGRVSSFLPEVEDGVFRRV